MADYSYRRSIFSVIDNDTLRLLREAHYNAMTFLEVPTNYRTPDITGYLTFFFTVDYIPYRLLGCFEASGFRTDHASKKAVMFFPNSQIGKDPQTFIKYCSSYMNTLSLCGYSQTSVWASQLPKEVFFEEENCLNDFINWNFTPANYDPKMFYLINSNYT